LFQTVKLSIILSLIFSSIWLVKYNEVSVKKIILLISLLLITSFSYSIKAQSTQGDEADNLCVEGSDRCTFVLLSEKNKSLSTINDKRANTALSPFSTFKVANSLIALDSGVITSTQQTLTFNKEKYPVQAWWPPVWKLPSYNLTTAFKYSMVPVYRQMATDIGQEKMQQYLTQFDYGNEDISSGLDDFWLNGSIKISAVEQVDFLQKLYRNQLKVKATSIDTLKEVMLVTSTNEYQLYAKTGAGWIKNNNGSKIKKSMLGWYIGFVENSQGVHYFAFNFTRDTYPEMKANRVKMAMNHLKAAGII